MAKLPPRVIFEPRKIANGDWQIRAHIRGTAEIEYIDCFESETAAREWPRTACREWLKTMGLA